MAAARWSGPGIAKIQHVKQMPIHPLSATSTTRAGASAIVGSHHHRTLATSTAEEATPLQKTALYEFHQTLGGDMVAFAGYSLPIMYKGAPESSGIMNEHLWCRSPGKASIFDVSHMGQVRWRGSDRVKFLETLVVGDIQGLGEGDSCLSLLTNQNGGIIDDTVITNVGDVIDMVINGATKDTDLEHMRQQMSAFDGHVEFDLLHDTHGLIALQGSGAVDALLPFLPGNFDITKMKFMSSTDVRIHDVNCRMTRCGYTGEDGFELSIPTEDIVEITKLLLDNPNVKMAGLGARDSLRLEAGLCLYGHDIDDQTTPIEAALGWTLGPPGSRRRVEQGFLGAEHILTPEGKFRPVERKRIGITGMKAPAREGSIIYSGDGSKEIGKVTSGTFSPTLKKPIAMGYVASEFTKVGTPIQVKIREKLHSAVITKMPFVQPSYYRIPE